LGIAPQNKLQILLNADEFAATFDSAMKVGAPVLVSPSCLPFRLWDNNIKIAQDRQANTQTWPAG